MTLSMKQLPTGEATDGQLDRFAREILGLDFGADENPSRDKLLAQIANAWPREFILVPDTVAAPEAITAAEIEESQPPPPPARPEPAQAAAAPPAAPPPAQAVSPRKLKDSAATDPTVQLLIHEAEGPGGKRGVFVGVNGVGMLIPRGKMVDVPYRYYLNLNNAVRTHHEVIDERTGETEARDVHAYPFSIYERPPADIVAAWLARETDRQARELGTSTPAAA